MQKFALVCCVFLFASGCATSAITTSSYDLPNLPATATGLALPVEYDSSRALSPNEGCVLEFVQDGAAAVFDINVMPGRDTVFAALPPGTFEYRSVTCGKRTWNIVYKKWARFQIFPEKISLVEGLTVYLTGADNMTFQRSNRARSREEALRFFGRIPEEARGRVVSGYTGANIPASALDHEARFKNWEFTDGNGKTLKNTKNEWPSFKSCYDGEDVVNPLWLGNIHLNATYENGNLSNTEQLESWDSFTPHFLDCAKSKLKEFHPSEKEKRTIGIYI